LLPEDFEISPELCSNEHLKEAEAELLAINNFDTPREKLHCILKCCKQIFVGISSWVEKGKGVGADDFVPVLVYVVLQSNPPSIYSNLQYIKNYRNASRMHDESGYYFVSFVTALTYLENLNPNELFQGKKEILEDRITQYQIKKREKEKKNYANKK